MSVAKFPQQPSVEHMVLLELVDALDPLDPILPLDAELRLDTEPTPGLGDLDVLLGITILDRELEVAGKREGESIDKTGALPVTWSGTYSVGG